MSTFFTVDFEDFSHDLGRHIGLKPIIQPRIDALYKSYDEINNLIKSFQGSKNKGVTFFITGVLAEKVPELIAKISRDGHEVACHYYYHDVMHSQNIKEVEYMLKKSIDKLEIASNSKILGFRAPYFKIDKIHSQQYQLIEKLFKYDSSLCINSKEKLNLFYKRMGLKTLKIFPVYSDKVGLIPLRTGGTFAKIFPIFIMKTLLKKNLESKLNEIFYLHPYEFKNGKDWKLSSSDLSNLPTIKKFYWLARQNQWLNFGNKNLNFKISQLLENRELSGPLKGLI